jgi:hypothetical protein
MGGLTNFRQALQKREMLCRKSVRTTGKRLQDTDRSFAAGHGDDGDRTDPENAANLWIDPVICLSVVTAESPARAEAFTGYSRVNIELAAEGWSDFTGASTADNCAAAAQGKRDAARAGQHQPRIGDGRKNGVDGVGAVIQNLA